MAEITELDEYVVKADGKYTFFGVLNDFYEDIFARCGEKTRRSYNSEYNRLVLPILANCVLEECEYADFESAIEKIETQGHYSQSSLQHYRYLIRTVVKQAVKRGICEDVLYGSIFSLSPDEKPDTAKKKEFVRLRKSLRIEEERRLYAETMVDPMQDGERMGLALMLADGLRNSEACGVKFGAVRPMESRPDCYCIWMYESTIKDTSELKIGGKTRNAPRILPVPPKLLELILKRKAYLQTLLNEGRIELKPDQKSIEDLPVACKKSDYTEHCSSGRLTTAGRLLLKAIQVSEEEVAYIDRELQSKERMIEMGVTEKDPTAYLLRRNLGTHLSILGLTEAEIQYFMGHDIDDTYEKRNYFTNEDKLESIVQKLANRPLFNVLYPHKEAILVSDGTPSLQRGSVPAATIQFKAEHTAIAALQVTAVEKKDELRVCIQTEGEEPVMGKITVLPAMLQRTPRTVNIVAQYQKSYQEKIK